MKTGNPFVLFIFLISLAIPVSAFPQSGKEISHILDAAEMLFKEMKNRNYSIVWDTITTKSRKTIIKDTFKELKKVGENLSREEIKKDFDRCETLCKAYWDGFLATFDPHLALEQSKWDIGPIEKNRADILITHKKSEKPARLQMFKEGGNWKVGLVETFGTRK